ncbi:HNH endonuclease [Variovorax sp. YR566]|uniref:HNH endonuclease n=1 Tax=Variovorax sp. YR566 TaxID=3450237 RepID=UPI003F7E2FF2
MIEESEPAPEVTVAMRDNLARLKNALYEWLVKEEILGDAAFYTVETWRQRGEEYLTDSLLVLTFDGSTLHTMLNFGGDTDEFDDLVESFGFYYGLGNHWNLGFYPQDGYDYSRSVGTYASKLRDPRWQKKADAVRRKADQKCQDCGSAVRLDAHHCYYTNMREGYEPWEYPLSALRALCRDCHIERDRAEIRMRAFAASMTRHQLDALRPALSHATYWYSPEAVFAFMSRLGPEERHIDNALKELRAGRVEHE